MPDVPVGYCQCGCGGKTKPARKTSRAAGTIKGRPVRYIYKHARKPHKAERYRVVDLGYTTPCWIWVLATSNDGYGRIGGTAARTTGRIAHRVYYAERYGPIPEGLVVDHLCRNRACVNPAHLEAVPPGENVARTWDIRRWYSTHQTFAAILACLTTTLSNAEIEAMTGISNKVVWNVRHRKQQNLPSTCLPPGFA